MRFAVHPVPGHGTEDVLVATGGRHEGSVYTGTLGGVVLRVSPDGRRATRVATTGGRPLGIEEHPDGSLVVCDSHRGLLRVDPGSGRVEVLADRIDGVPMRFCNNASVAPDGTIWFSDSSREHTIEQWREAFVQDLRSGRLLRRDPDGALEVVLDGLAFSNGVALAPDGSWVVVAETRTRTLVRLWLSGPRAGERELLARDLPGYPDNIATGTDGLVWVSLASPVDPLVERISGGPMWLRRTATRVPERLQPREQRTVRVQAYGADGTLVRDLDLTEEAGGRFHMVTGVREHEGRLWLGSLEEPAVAVLVL